MARILKPPEGCEYALKIIVEGFDATGRWDHFHIRAQFVTIGPAKRFEECPTGGLCDPPSELEGLEVYSQGNPDEENRHLYAWQICAQVRGWRCLEGLQKMVAGMKHIEGYLERATAREGYPAHFGQYVARVANAVGARWMLFAPPDGKREWDSGYAWHNQDIGDGAWHIADIIERWRAAGEKVVA